ncbi:hypothetical protein Nepgr_031993 [Nepenthes gracilis]|uniref:Transcription initiation factor TFIID subunit 12 domain-containing protein n=1 Tax=Nepenthes gracilis TaxID=150966 RepID=A0AAD3Y7B7_NEPGR|nr:hypothetical protein Nepgr_031993 [Nepenthes gracilis]
MEPASPTSQSTGPPQQQQAQLPPPSRLTPPSSSMPSNSSSTIPQSPNPNPSQNPNSNPKPPTTVQQHPPPPQSLPQSQSQTRGPLNRPWSQPSHFSHFPSYLQPVPSPSSSSSPVPSSSVPSSVHGPPRGGIAKGFPATSSPAQPTSLPASFSSSLAQQYGGLARSPVGVTEPVSNSSSSPAKPAVLGMQNVGMISSPIRPNSIPAHHQQRPVQSSSRPQLTSNNQPSASQNFQAHGLLKASSVEPTSSSSPSLTQGLQSQNQPWLAPGSHGRPPLPTSSFRAPMNPQSLQQRSHAVQPSLHSLPAASQQQQLSSSHHQQQPFALSNQSQENHGQLLSSSRVPQSLAGQQQSTRVQGLGNQKSPSPVMVQPSNVQANPNDRTAVAEADESGNSILSKRSIQELINQIDPSEKLDPEVQDILVDIAEDFVDSITTYGCLLAKHRKSNTLEAKDILLHLERNWNMTLPGFIGDEIKMYRKPLASDAHRERLAAIRKSIAGAEVVNAKSSAAQSIFVGISARLLTTSSYNLRVKP